MSDLPPPPSLKATLGELEARRRRDTQQMLALVDAARGVIAAKPHGPFDEAERQAIAAAIEALDRLARRQRI